MTLTESMLPHVGVDKCCGGGLAHPVLVTYRVGLLIQRRDDPSDVCLQDAQESTAPCAGKDARADIQASRHLEIPMSAGLALNPPSSGHAQLQNGSVHGGHSMSIITARTCQHAEPHFLHGATAKG